MSCRCRANPAAVWSPNPPNAFKTESEVIPMVEIFHLNNTGVHFLTLAGSIWRSMPAAAVCFATPENNQSSAPNTKTGRNFSICAIPCVKLPTRQKDEGIHPYARVHKQKKEGVQSDPNFSPFLAQVRRHTVPRCISNEVYTR